MRVWPSVTIAGARGGGRSGQGLTLFCCPTPPQGLWALPSPWGSLTVQWGTASQVQNCSRAYTAQRGQDLDPLGLVAHLL